MADATEKRCATCGKYSPSDANFCVWCGASRFEESTLQPTEHPEVVEQVAVGLSIRRVILFSAVSSGLYIIYWAYLTWDQLKKETREDYYPAWHALSMFVPIYNLFRLFAHITAIKDRANYMDVNNNLSPGLCVVLFLLSSIISVIVGYSQIYGVVVALSVISLILTTTLLVWAQGTLNAYWIKAKEVRLQEAKLGVGELIVVFIGMLSWTLVLVPF